MSQGRRIETVQRHLRAGGAVEAHAGAAGGMMAAADASANGANQVAVFGKVGRRSPNDVVIVAAARSAICKGNRGSFKDTTPDDILKAVFEETVRRSKVDASVFGDIIIGNVQLGGAYALGAREAQLRAGIPETVPLVTVNRQCASGMQAVASIAAEIQAGYIDAGLAGGVESMTHGGNPSNPSGLPPLNLEAVFEHPVAKESLTAMGITSENVAEKYGVTREEQDRLAVLSHERALKAQKEGWFKEEIVPITVKVKDKDGNAKEVVVDTDEGPKPGTTMEVLAKLKPAFKKGGSTTAGNASQVSDGAACVALMRRSYAEKLGAPILGVFRGFKVVGVPPEIMGVGPRYAIPALLKDVGLSLSDVDLFEINEAFASQATFTIKELGLSMDKVNVVGSGISLGHPLGATGARLVVTSLNQMKRLNKRLAVNAACVGGGQGFAALIERE